MNKYDVLIVGAGPAGLTAAIYAKRAGCDVAVFEELMPGGQVATTFEIENYPGFPLIGGIELSMKFHDHAISAGVEIIYEAPTELDLHSNPKLVKCGERVYETCAVIIATGTKRRMLGVDGEKQFAGRGVSYCATCDGNFFKGKDVAVVGGGNSAVEDAIYLSNLCNKVYLVHRRGEFRASQTLIDRLPASGNIELVLNSQVSKINGDNKVTSIQTQSKTIPVDGVFIAIGSDPQNALFANDPALTLAPDGSIITDESCRTSIKNVYAAGDIRNKPLRQIITAAADGAIAGWEVGNERNA
jgi:thioredoxin-disulfide reductase